MILYSAHSFLWELGQTDVNLELPEPAMKPIQMITVSHFSVPRLSYRLNEKPSAPLLSSTGCSIPSVPIPSNDLSLVSSSDPEV